MGATHGDTGIGEVERLVYEYIERDMLAADVEREVEDLLRRGETREAFDVAYEHNRATRRRG